MASQGELVHKIHTLKPDFVRRSILISSAPLLDTRSVCLLNTVPHAGLLGLVRTLYSDHSTHSQFANDIRRWYRIDYRASKSW